MFKRIFCSLLAVVTLSSCLLTGAQAAESVPMPEMIEPSEQFTEYISDTTEWGDKLVPSFINLNELSDDSTAESTNGNYAPLGVPAAYSSVDMGYTTSVKNQGSDGTCAYFSTMGTLETYLKKTTGVTYNFSEQHAKLITASAYTDGNSIYGYSRQPNEGSHFSWIVPHLTLGAGPVDENDMPYANGSQTYTKSAVESLKPELLVTDARFLPGLGSSPSASDKAAWIQSLKEMVYKYGAVSISVNMLTDYMNSDYEYLYYCGEEIDHNHAVVVVGWDDSVSASNFTTHGSTPSQNGAFIIRNSWGSGYHGDGYFYYSYDSVGIARQDAMAFTGVDSFDSECQTVNTYSEHGMTSAIGYTSTSSAVYYGNKFYLAAGEKVSLDAVNFYITKANMKYEVYVSTTGSTSSSSLKKVASGTSDKVGYYTADIDSIALGNDNADSTYFVAVKVFPNAQNVYSIPIEYNYYDLLASYASEYIAYTENGEKKTVANTSANTSALSAKGISYSSVSTSYYALEGYSFSEASGYNVVINAVTSKEKSTPVTGITLYKDDAKTVNGGSISVNSDDYSDTQAITFTAAVTPNNADDTTYTLSCSNQTVAEVNANSVKIYPARATESCNAVITATSTDGGYTASYTVKITYTQPEPEAETIEAYVFVVGQINAYWNTYNYGFTCDQPCTFVDGSTYVPFRIIATAAGAKSVNYNSDDGTVVIENSSGMVFTLTMAKKECSYVAGGTTYSATLNSAPQFINGVCCLPVRDVTNITFASVEYIEIGSTGYVLVSGAALTDTEKQTVINNYTEYYGV